MKFPFITRKEHEAKIASLEVRLIDIERHFVTKRDEQGRPIETLADRAARRGIPPKRINMQQMLKWLSATDGGRKVPDGERT